MAKYGEVAILAVKKLHSKENTEPVEAWQSAAEQIFTSESSIKKGCPRSTFLSLCQHGLIRGIEKGTYTKAKENKEYALKAVELLMNDSDLADHVSVLWGKVAKSDIKSNQQMDVVIALWREGLIKS